MTTIAARLDAVRARIDWKYALGLELTDPGFHFSVLTEFRARLVTLFLGMGILMSINAHRMLVKQ